MHGLERGIHHFESEQLGDSAALLQGVGLRNEVVLVACSDLGSDRFGLLGTHRSRVHVVQNVANIVEPVDSEPSMHPTAIEQMLVLAPIRDIVIRGHVPCGLFDAITSGVFEAHSAALGKWLLH